VAKRDELTDKGLAKSRLPGIALWARQYIVVAAKRPEVDRELDRPVNILILIRTILFIENAEIEAIAIVANTDGISEQLALLDVIAHTAIETPAAGKIPPEAAPDLLLVVWPVYIRIRNEARIGK
jgi:hypothetical protein